MARTKTSRSTTAFQPVNVYQAQRPFLATIIHDAIMIMRGERAGSDLEKMQCRRFLQSEKCRRWLDFLDLHPDCLRRII